jgi:uncharacterized membrane protein
MEPVDPAQTTHHHRQHHPALVRVEAKRAESIQLRVADQITRFAGSVAFVYIHVVIFTVWCATALFGVDKYPFAFLTLTVSLEAIFLSTFVLIGQNRQADFAQAKADHDFHEQEQLLKENTELTRMIAKLTTELHEKLLPDSSPPANG